MLPGHWIMSLIFTSNVFSERDLQRQIKLTKDQLRDLRASNETNQVKLLNQSERQGEAILNWNLSFSPV